MGQGLVVENQRVDQCSEKPQVKLEGNKDVAWRLLETSGGGSLVKNTSRMKAITIRVICGSWQSQGPIDYISSELSIKFKQLED